MKTIVKNFSDYFVKELGKFAKEQKESGKKAGLNNNEINSVITETFFLLGRKHEEWKKLAEIK
jgi:hypothetical protein